MTIAVTGSDGFVGLRLCDRLEASGHSVLRIARRSEGPGRVRRALGDLSPDTDWLPVLRGVDAIVHLAGRAHVTTDSGDQSRDLYQRSNVEVTRRLALDAGRAGVRRFVFVSSIGVNGASTENQPFRESDSPRPENAYARSKLEAEQVLRQVARETALELVIVRPPLIYGPGAKGNLLRMLRLVASGLPLPLQSLQNRRHLVGLDNACDVLALCLRSPSAAGQTFLLAEPEPYSTPQILAALYAGMGLRNKLFPFPVSVLRAAAQLAGLGAVFEKLGASLEVDPTNMIRTLRWSPACSFSEGMKQTATWYLRTRGPRLERAREPSVFQ